MPKLFSKSALGATVVVPTLNRGSFLEPCLRDILAQTYRPLEILVVDQSDTAPDPVMELVSSNLPLISYHQVDFRGLPIARNYGWQHARYDRIVFVDDDIRCGAELVAEHVQALDLQDVGAVAGGIDEAHKKKTFRNRTGHFSKWTATPHGGFNMPGQFTTDGGRGCNFSVRREAIRKARGVDEAMNIGAALYEETDMFLRIAATGYRLWYNGDARLTHLAAPSGGCRTNQVEAYVYSLAHNRSILIRRHTKFYHHPTAFGRLALLAISYARAYRNPRALWESLRGARDGFRAGAHPPTCSIFETKVKNT